MKLLFACLVVSLPLADAAAQRAAPDLFAASRLARAEGRYRMLRCQFRADEPTLPDHHEAGEKPAVAAYQRTANVPAGFWVWQRPYWFVFRDGPDSAALQRQWGPEAACGPPDVPAPGDHGSAWATMEEDAANEWLLLEYSPPVRATSLEVHETFKPGAVRSVAILLPDGEELELWRAKDQAVPNDPGRILQIDLPVGFEVERVKLYFASEVAPGWNEIDAVGIKDDKGKMHWAERADASSTYADAEAQRGGNQAFPGAWQQIAFQPIAIQPLAIQLPRVVLQAPEVGEIQLPRIQWQAADGDEKKQLRERIAELEALVKRLRAELEQAKAKR
ncbi:MAG TPA: hypothetical protein VF384_12940 [Planctomycetota bacterium]